MTTKEYYTCPDLHILAVECNVICSSQTELGTIENEEIVILEDFVW